MPLAEQLQEHQRLQYQNSVTMVAQQMGDPLAAAVTETPVQGRAVSISDLFGKVKAVKEPERNRTNLENPVSGTRRWLVRQQAILSGQYIDKEDKLDNVVDPTSHIVKAHTAAVRRAVMEQTLGVSANEDGIMTVTGRGIMGGATEGREPSSAVAMPGSQTVPRSTTGLTAAKLRDTLLTLRQADFGMEDSDPLYAVIGPKQMDDLLAIAAEAGPSLNLFNVEQFRAGKPSPLLGINWLWTNSLPVASDDETVRLCPVFSKGNIVRGFWEPLYGDIVKDPHARMRPYAWVEAMLDCSRVQDKGVIIIECNED
jgi:hypothetical protein